MSIGRGGPLPQIHRLYDDGTAAGLADAPLRERFAARRDEVALEALVARHGPMVRGVCRRVLVDPHDVDDAFQATFLVLARKAGTLRDRNALGPWLHSVAHKVSLRARALASRRRAIERLGLDDDAPAPSPDADSDPADLDALDDEIRRLPASLRDPVILCLLEGHTYEEAAIRLRSTPAAVRGRLARARARLRDRLTRRGLSRPAGVIAATVAGEGASNALASSLPAATAGTTARSIAAFVSGHAEASGLAPAVVALAESVLRMMSMTQIKLAAAALLATALVATGTAALAYPQAPQQDRRPRGAEVVARPAARPERPGQPPHVLEPPDMILVEVLQALTGRPITGERVVRPDGTISLGFYGDVPVAGLTLKEAKAKVIERLRKFLKDEALGLVDDDGAPVKPEDSDRVYVDVAAFNSKNYYVEGEMTVPSRLPVTGNETVLDAIHFAGGPLPGADTTKMRLIRRGKPGQPDVVMPVNYAEITGGTDSSTNYFLQPGDRLFVPFVTNVDTPSHEEVPEPAAAPANPQPTAARTPMAPAPANSPAIERRLAEVESELDRILRKLDRLETSQGPKRDSIPRKQ